MFVPKGFMYHQPTRWIFFIILSIKATNDIISYIENKELSRQDKRFKIETILFIAIATIYILSKFYKMYWNELPLQIILGIIVSLVMNSVIKFIKKG